MPEPFHWHGWLYEFGDAFTMALSFVITTGICCLPSIGILWIRHNFEERRKKLERDNQARG